MGLVNKVFPQETFTENVRDYARILTDTVSPHSVAVIKAQLWKAMHESYIEHLAEVRPTACAELSVPGLQGRRRALHREAGGEFPGPAESRLSGIERASVLATGPQRYSCLRYWMNLLRSATSL